MTETGVLRAFIQATTNAVGCDNVIIKFFLMTPSVTLSVITGTFNKSISSNTFPSRMKSQFPKCSGPASISKFRPINFLPALSKYFERVVQQLSTYLDSNIIISKFQTSFGADGNNTTSFIQVTRDIRLAMDKW